MTVNFTPTQKQSKIFILGATGFIGFALAKRLVELGFDQITCLCRSQEKARQLFSGLDTAAITFLYGDVSQPEVLKQGLDGAQIVVNASGSATDWGSHKDIWEVNVEAPKRIIQMIAESPDPAHYIQITSASVYGFSWQVKTESSPLVKSDPFYTASKVDLHDWLRKEMQKKGRVPFTTLAPSIVWGPGDRTYVPAIKQGLKTGKVLFITDALPVDFVHIDDLLDAILCCFFNERTYQQEYIISGPEQFPFYVYIQKIAEFCGLPLPKRRQSMDMLLGTASMMEATARIINLFKPGYVPKVTRLQVLLLSVPFTLSIDKATQELGYQPTIGFYDGIEGLRDYARSC